MYDIFLFRVVLNSTPLTMATEGKILAPVLIIILLFPLAWHIVQLSLGFEYESDNCNDLDYWAKVGGSVGIGIVGTMMLGSLVSLCSAQGGAGIVIAVGALYGLWLLAWTIYGFVLLFEDDGLKVIRGDHGHNSSLWIYCLVNCILTISGGICGVFIGSCQIK